MPYERYGFLSNRQEFAGAMVMGCSLEKKVKQKAEIPIEEYNLKFTLSADEVTDERTLKEGWVKVYDVLALLDGYKIIPIGKWQQIVKLIKNRPPKSCTNHASLRLYYEEAQKVFEDLEAKLAETGEEANE